MELKDEAFINENLLLTRGAAKILGVENENEVRSEYTFANETDNSGCEKTPHAALQLRDESEIQSVAVHMVLESDNRKDADAVPYIPLTLATFPPVDGKNWNSCM